MYYMILTFLQVLEETGFDMSFFADPDAYLEHNFQDHQVRVWKTWLCADYIL